MRRKISGFAKFAGVSVRTLRWYDEIGLLKPDAVDALTGYRYYGETAEERMREIASYRELDFPLETIRMLLDSPQYDKAAAMQRQKELLIVKKAHLEHMIAAIEAAQKGEPMPKQTDPYETERAAFEQEAKKCWGDTDAYHVFEKQTDANKQSGEDALNALMDAFAAEAGKGTPPTDPAVLRLVGAWQDAISAHFYPCTDAILKGLGQMYTADERFRKNMDAHGEGTATLLSEAIAVYCERKQ